MINATCPICGRRMQSQLLTDWPQFPFCSQRCKTIDLGRWLNESYGIKKEEPDQDAEDLEHPSDHP
jgi:endogenous inhibitor of DNA gyrase (YacG/DUF329 family)